MKINANWTRVADVLSSDEFKKRLDRIVREQADNIWHEQRAEAGLCDCVVCRGVKGELVWDNSQDD